jgi:hypothetical protein
MMQRQLVINYPHMYVNRLNVQPIWYRCPSVSLLAWRDTSDSRVAWRLIGSQGAEPGRTARREVIRTSTYVRAHSAQIECLRPL